MKFWGQKSQKKLLNFERGTVKQKGCAVKLGGRGIYSGTLIIRWYALELPQMFEYFFPLKSEN